MTEQHDHELAPTTEPAGVALGPVFHDGPLKLGAGNNCNIWLKMLETRIIAALVLLMSVVRKCKMRGAYVVMHVVDGLTSTPLSPTSSSLS